MTLASASDLFTYLADLVERLERYAITLLPPNDADEIALGKEPDGSLVIDLEGRLPTPRRSKDVDLLVFERWRAIDADEWVCVEYAYELRHRELDYRRALHRHDEDHFVRWFGVATHEHCEVPMGVVTCGHYRGMPVADAFDAFKRLYEESLGDEKPDCRGLPCLG